MKELKAPELTNPRNSLLWLLPLVVVVRGVFALVVLWRHGKSGFLQQDSAVYIGLAQSLLHGRFGDTVSEIFRTPGYPMFLVPAVALGHVIFIGLLENFALAAGCAWLIWRIVNETVSDLKAAKIALLFFAFEPLGVLLCNQLLSDLLFSALILVFVWLVIRYLKTQRLETLGISLLVLAVATYVRPVTLYLAVWLVPLLLLFPRTSSWSKRVVVAVSFPVLFSVTLFPWVLRNAAVADYKGFTSSGDFNLYFYAAPAVLTRIDPKTFDQFRSEFGWTEYMRPRPDQARWSQGQKARFWHKEALSVISSHPRTYLLLHVRGCAVVLFDSAGTVIATALDLYPQNAGLLTRIQVSGILGGLLWLFHQHPGVGFLFIVLEAGLIAVYLLALAGLRWFPFEVAALFLWLTLYFVAVSGFPGAVARYRAPFVPLICIAAGAGLASLVNRFGRNNQLVAKAGALGQNLWDE